MPYEIKQSSKGYCVHKQGDDKPVLGGCHKSKSKALRHLRALYANEPEAMKADGKGYGAKVGETISGNLVRGAGGKFSSSGSAQPAETEGEEKPRARRQKLGTTEARNAAAKLQAREDKKRATASASEAKRLARRQETERRRAAIKKQQEAEKQRQLAANRKAVIDATQLDDASLSALEQFAKGGNLEPGEATDMLVALGLVTKSPTTGEYVMTGPGKSLLSAVNSGDIRQAKDAENAGREARATERSKRARQEERERRRSKSNETLKHGKHNQGDHGRRYSSSRKQLRSAARASAVEAANRVGANEGGWDHPFTKAVYGSRDAFVQYKERQLYREALAQRQYIMRASDLSDGDKGALRNFANRSSNEFLVFRQSPNSHLDANTVSLMNALESKGLIKSSIVEAAGQSVTLKYDLTSDGQHLLGLISR